MERFFNAAGGSLFEHYSFVLCKIVLVETEMAIVGGELKGKGIRTKSMLIIFLPYNHVCVFVG